MKHPLSVTLLLIFLFFGSQILGLSLVMLNIQSITPNGNQQVVAHGTTIVGDRPQTTGAQSFVFIVIGVTVGTALLLLLIRLKAFLVWKIWFLLAIWLSTSVALGVIMPTAAAFSIALILSIWKLFKPNPIVHNVTEMFMYAGIAVLLAPIFDLLWGIVLLLAISVYDMVAVWYSKHMVTMAQAQTQNNLFAGLYIPKGNEDKKALHARTPVPPGKNVTHITMPKAPKAPIASAQGSGAAILGGGDIAFPLIFTCIVFSWLIESHAVAPVTALYESLIIIVCSTLALTALFWYAKKDRFYPAMPFLSAGCFLGLAIVALL